MISLFPNSFNEKMCDQLLAHLHRWVDVLAGNAKQTRRGEVREINKKVGPTHVPTSTYLGIIE